MLSTLQHRGPDDEGVWDAPDGPLTLGHRRLSVIDTSATGHEPMLYAGGRFVLTFNGEIYNFLELRDELLSLGHTFRSTSDAEVLLAGYVQWGELVLGRLVGMFAFAIWDARERTLFLARDRAGEKPLYYAHDGERFAFASSLSALRRVPWVDVSLDPDAMTQYLQYGYVPAPLSAYKGVKKLRPAHYLVFDGRATLVKRYWDPFQFAIGPRTELSEAEAQDQLGELLRRSVRQQMVADVPLGAFLSGGIDSSTVVALMCQEAARVKTFTIGFDEAEYDESRHAETIAAHLGTEHVTQRLSTSEAMAMADSLHSDFGEPFGDPSALPMRMVSQVARREVTVSLSGDGGDELFGGYAVYERLQRLHRAVELVKPFRSTLLPLAARAPSGFGRRARRLLNEVSTGPSVAYRHYFTTSEVERMTGAKSLSRGVIDEVWQAASSLSPMRRAMVTDFCAYLPEDVLTKVDRAAMSVSLETRAPMLDHRIVEWALALPDGLVSRKRLLRGVLSRLVPPELYEREKQGFDVPIARWLRRDLKEPLLDELTPAALSEVGIVDPEPLSRMVAAHMKGSADYGRWIWLVYCMRRWHRSQLAQDEPVAA